jgi:hypothetical protein
VYMQHMILSLSTRVRGDLSEHTVHRQVTTNHHEGVRRGRGVQLHAILTAALNAGELHGLSVLPPRKGPPVLTAKETRWDPEPI